MVYNKIMLKPDFKDLVKDLEKRTKDTKDRSKELTDQQTIVRSLDLVQRAVVQSIGILIQTLVEDTLKTQVTNQKEFPKSFGTPDALAGAQTVKSAIQDLKEAVVGKDVDLSGVLTHLEGIHGVLEKLPTEYPSFPEMPTEMAVNNLGEMCDKLDAIGIELQNLKLDPKIEVKAPEVTIDLSKEIKQIEKAVKSISKEVKIPEQKETDLSPLIEAMNGVKTTIQNIQFPVPNFRTADIVDAIENINISTGDITVGAFSDSGGTDRKALVDGDRHLQVDVLSAPATSINTTGLATDTKQDAQTALLTTIDADTSDIHTNTDAMVTDLAAMETLLTTIESNQLPDGHNVTVDNASLAVTATDLDIRNLTATDVVTANLSATDNAVLDSIDTKLSTINSAQLPDGHNVTIDNPGDIGGGTQYTDGDADATPTGTVAMGFDGTNVQALNVDSSGNLQTEVTNTVTVDGSGVTQPISASSLPLPTGAATAANQQTDALTDTELRATPVVVDLGANNDVTVTGTVTANLGATDNAVLDDIAANQTDNSQKTQIVDASGNAVGVTGNALDVNATVDTTGLATSTKQDTIIGHIDGIEGLLTTIDADTSALAGAVSGTEVQVDVVSGVQTDALTDTQLRATPIEVDLGANNDVTITGTVPVTDNGGSLTVDGAVAATQSGTWNVNNILGTVSLPTGAATSALQTTGNSTLSTISTNTSVRGGTGTTTSVNDTTTSTQLAASATGRKELFITNTSSASLYVKFGTTASSTSFAVILQQNETLIDDKYTGVVHGVWASDPNDGAAVITVVT